MIGGSDEPSGTGRRLGFARNRAGANLLLPTFLLAILLLVLVSAAASAQSPPAPTATSAATPNPSSGEISGLVIGDDGQPLADAHVLLSSARNQTNFSPPKEVNAQTNGRFRFTKVRTGVYYLFANSPGYVLPDNPDPQNRPEVYRVGSNATLMLFRGGVITGTVTDVTGEPVIGLQVSAVRVRDSLGRKPQSAFGLPEARTDDRGIYRIYGLPGGTYIVAAGGVSASGAMEFIRSSWELAPVYYPSSTAEGAVKVEVGLGQETGGIDIRIGGELGHAISGTVVGATHSPDGKALGVVAVLQRPNNGPQAAMTFLQEQNGEIRFTFSHVPDGEYELLAESWQRDNGGGSAPQRVTIKGMDVTGIRLTMAAFGSVSGRLVLDADATLRDRAECAATGRPATVDEFLLDLRPAKPRGVGGLTDWANRSGTVPEEDGKFTSAALRAGSYWPVLNFPDDRWYLRSVTRPGPAGKPVNGLVTGQTNGLLVGGGEKITGLTVTVTDGAAGLKGRLAPPEGASVSPSPTSTMASASPVESSASPTGRSASPIIPGAAQPTPATPAHVLVHLIPAEPTAADDVLRYREVEAEADGTFALANLAPGKYWIYAEPFPPAATAPTGDGNASVRIPAAWDPAARAKLRRAAETANVLLELKPCQRVDNFTVRLPGKP